VVQFNYYDYQSNLFFVSTSDQNELHCETDTSKVLTISHKLLGTIPVHSMRTHILAVLAVLTTVAEGQRLRNEKTAIIGNGGPVENPYKGSKEQNRFQKNFIIQFETQSMDW
jgi:hypothetical protein